MPRARTAMRKVKEVLRLRYDLQMSYSQIRLSCGVSNGALNGLLTRAAKAGLNNWAHGPRSNMLEGAATSSFPKRAPITPSVR